MRRHVFWFSLFLAACGSDDDDDAEKSTNDDAIGEGEPTSVATSSQPWGEVHTGNFWLGPVDYAETEWHNACAPSVKYPKAIAAAYGDFIIGLANEVSHEGLSASAGQLCDACVQLQANGHDLIAHVVTYGQETGPNDIDVSPQIDAALDAAAGRNATWQFVSCPTSDPIRYTFDGRQWDNTWFFRVWVRNSRLPLTRLQYRVGSGQWSSAERQNDGAWQAASQDFAAGFSVRLTALHDQTLTDDIPGLNTFDPDEGIISQGNFE